MSAQTWDQFLSDRKREKMDALSNIPSTIPYVDAKATATRLREAIALLPTMEAATNFDLPIGHKPAAEARDILEALVLELDPPSADVHTETDADIWSDYLNTLGPLGLRRFAQSLGVPGAMVVSSEDLLESLDLFGPPTNGR